MKYLKIIIKKKQIVLQHLKCIKNSGKKLNRALIIFIYIIGLSLKN